MSDSWRPEQSLQERLNRTQLSMTPGTLHGRIAQAAPVHRSRGDEDQEPVVVDVPFSYATTPMASEESPPYFNRIAEGEIGSVSVATNSNTSGSSTFSIRVNGGQVATITIPSGEKTTEVILEDVVVSYGDRITVRAESVHGSLNGVTVQVLIEVP